MKMKKVCCLMLGGLALCGLCGCGNQNSSDKNSSDNNSNTQQVDEKTLVTYHTPDAIKNRGELKVGVMKETNSGADEDLDGGLNYLYSKDDQGNYEGFNIRLSNELAKELGESVKATFVEFNDEKELLESLSNGSIDMAISTLGYTNDLAEKYTLSDSYWPYEVEPTPLYVLDSAKDTYKSLSDFSSLKVAVPKGYNFEQVVSENLPNAQLVLCDDIKQAIEKIKNGEADTIFCASQFIDEELKNEKTIVKSNVTIPEDASKLGLFIGMMKDNEQLKTSINASLDKFKKNEKDGLQSWLIDEFQKAYTKKFDKQSKENSGEKQPSDNGTPDVSGEKMENLQEDSGHVAKSES